MSTYIKGLDTVMANLNTELAAMENRALQGLIEAAIIIRRDMDDTPPLIPIDIGNLRGSYYTDAGWDDKGRPRVILGFTAAYAWYVHEMIGEDIHFSRPNSGPKFLEAALKRNADKVLKTIQQYVKGGL